MGEINDEFAVKITKILKSHEPLYEPWMLRRIMYKVLITLEAILEG